MDECEKKLLHLLMFGLGIIVVLMPLIATVLVSIVVYSTGWIKITSHGTDEEEYHGFQSDIFDGTNIPALAISCQVLTLLCSILVYMSFATRQKQCLRSAFLVIMSVAAVVLWIKNFFTLEASSVGHLGHEHSIPYCREAGVRCEQAIAFPLKTIILSLLLTNSINGVRFIYRLPKLELDRSEVFERMSSCMKRKEENDTGPSELDNIPDEEEKSGV